MTTIKAIIKGRRLEIDAPSDWPDGTEVEVCALGSAADSLSSAEIANTLAAMDAMEPFDLTEAELAAWEAARQTRKEREKAQFGSHVDELRRAWE